MRKPESPGKIGSGSPFYLAIEAGILDPSLLVEFGIQSHCNAPVLWEYIASKKVQVVPYEELRGGAVDAAARRRQMIDADAQCRQIRRCKPKELRA